MNTRNITMVFAAYLLGLGLVLVLLPNLFLAIFFLPPADGVWIRVTGMLVLILSYYYYSAGRELNLAFLRATIPGRTGVLLFLTLFVIVGIAEPIFIFFGAIDAAFAFVTWRAMRAGSKSGREI